MLCCQRLANVNVAKTCLATHLIELVGLTPLTRSILWLDGLFGIIIALERFHLVDPALITIAHLDVSQIALRSVNVLIFISVKLRVIIVLYLSLTINFNSWFIIVLQLWLKKRRRIDRSLVNETSCLWPLLRWSVAKRSSRDVSCLAGRLLRCLGLIGMQHHSCLDIYSFIGWICILQTMWWLFEESCVLAPITLIWLELCHIDGLALFHFRNHGRGLIAWSQAWHGILVLQLRQILPFPEELKHFWRCVVWLLIVWKLSLLVVDRMVGLLIVLLVLRLNSILNQGFLAARQLIEQLSQLMVASADFLPVCLLVFLLLLLLVLHWWIGV